MDLIERELRSPGGSVIDFRSSLVYYFNMAISSILIYEPIDSFRDKANYWKEYAEFYEKYWGGPTSPLGIWFGNEYEAFRNSLSQHLGMDKEEVEDCYFMKDSDNNYYVAPLYSKSNSAHSENIIPLDWFIMFIEEDRKSLYTHWGFNAIHYDTRIGTALDRIDEAINILSNCLTDTDKSTINKLFANNLSIMCQSLSDLQTWFSGFDNTGFVVLNYGEVCSYISPATLKNEQSVGEMGDFLELLKSGELEKASSSMRILFQKWEEIRSQASGEIDKSTLQ